MLLDAEVNFLILVWLLDPKQHVFIIVKNGGVHSCFR